MSDGDRERLRAVLSGVERRGPWTVPRHLDVRVALGSAELDLRQAVLHPGVSTIDVAVSFGSLELIVPPHLGVDVQVETFAGSVEHEAPLAPLLEDTTRPIVRVVGRVRFGSCEVVTLLPGETRADCASHGEGAHTRHGRRHARWHELRAEREMWRRSRHQGRTCEQVRPVLRVCCHCCHQRVHATATNAVKKYTPRGNTQLRGYDY